MNVALWLESTAHSTPSAPALLDGTAVVANYQEFARRAAAIAAALKDLYGIDPGDRVAVFMPNSTEYLECLYAIWWAGAVAVPVNAKLHGREADELASTKTMWSVGPITQAFTAIAIMQLKEQGKLSVDDPISKYLPDVPAVWGKVTILQLMQHASGIADFREAGYDGTKTYRPTQLVDLVQSKPLAFVSGTDVRLSATNFILLGLIIERASDMSYRDYVIRYQIEPLHLDSTMFASDFGSKTFLDRPSTSGFNQHDKFHSQVPYINPVEPATGYVNNRATLTPVDPMTTANLHAYGGIWSSAQDISFWDIALAGGVLVKEEADRDVIYKPTKLANGKVVPAMAGWEFTQHGFMEIKGNSPGFSSYLSRFTAADELVCVTLLTNKEGVDLTDLAREIGRLQGGPRRGCRSREDDGSGEQV